MYNRWMPLECSTELYHHGVKGMKWGVRKADKYRAQIARGYVDRENAQNYISRASKARQDYLAAKNDPYAKLSGRAKDLKRESKRLNKKSNFKKAYLNEKQAQWRIDKFEKKLNRLNGVADNRKVSMISPKTKEFGKKVAKTVLLTAASSVLGYFGGVAGAGALTLGSQYASSGAAGKFAFYAMGIDSLPKALIEGGRASVTTMLGGKYLNPTERAAEKAMKKVFGGQTIAEQIISENVITEHRIRGGFR